MRLLTFARLILIPAAFCLAAIATVPGLARCDDDGFYRKNFAESPLEDKRQVKSPIEGGKSKPVTAKQGTLFEPSEGQSSSAGFSEPEMEDQSSSEEAVLDPADAKAVPILAIDAVVNFIDTAHAKKVLLSLISVGARRPLRIRTMYAMGEPERVLALLEPSDRAALLTIAPDIHRTRELPKDLKVQASPSWIFYTEKGRYLGEGTEVLPRLIAANGKLKWPSATIAGGTPQIGVEKTG